MKKKIQSFEDLEVWRKAHDLVLRTYEITKAFPGDERYGLVSQMRRAGVSVASNIAEGFKKRGLKDKANFYNISQGSLEELRYYMILADDLGYAQNTSEMKSNINETGKMLQGLIKSVTKDSR